MPGQKPKKGRREIPIADNPGCNTISASPTAIAAPSRSVSTSLDEIETKANDFKYLLEHFTELETVLSRYEEVIAHYKVKLGWTLTHWGKEQDCKNDIHVGRVYEDARKKYAQLQPEFNEIHKTITLHAIINGADRGYYNETFCLLFIIFLKDKNNSKFIKEIKLPKDLEKKLSGLLDYKFNSYQVKHLEFLSNKKLEYIEHLPLPTFYIYSTIVGTPAPRNISLAIHPMKYQELVEIGKFFHGYYGKKSIIEIISDSIIQAHNFITTKSRLVEELKKDLDKIERRTSELELNPKIQNLEAKFDAKQKSLELQFNNIERYLLSVRKAKNEGYLTISDDDLSDYSQHLVSIKNSQTALLSEESKKDFYSYEEELLHKLNIFKQHQKLLNDDNLKLHTLVTNFTKKKFEERLQQILTNSFLVQLTQVTKSEFYSELFREKQKSLIESLKEQFRKQYVQFINNPALIKHDEFKKINAAQENLLKVNNETFQQELTRENWTFKLQIKQLTNFIQTYLNFSKKYTQAAKTFNLYLQNEAMIETSHKKMQDLIKQLENLENLQVFIPQNNTEVEGIYNIFHKEIINIKQYRNAAVLFKNLSDELKVLSSKRRINTEQKELLDKLYKFINQKSAEYNELVITIIDHNYSVDDIIAKEEKIINEAIDYLRLQTNNNQLNMLSSHVRNLLKTFIEKLCKLLSCFPKNGEMKTEEAQDSLTQKKLVRYSFFASPLEKKTAKAINKTYDNLNKELALITQLKSNP